MRPSTFLLFPLLLLVLPVQAERQNQLTDHASPYLAMHGDDPVHWQDWSEDVLAAARQEDKLIFISSGYFSCHWCHVMQRESYSNQGIADLLNEHFIPVKIDRELQSALDAHLIDYVEQTQGHAGWPLNVFITPEGYPLVGLTYQPREGFQQLLEQLNTIWTKDRQDTRDLARRVLLRLQEKPTAHDEVEPISSALMRKRFLEAAITVADTMSGGFGSQSRFPMAPQLMALLEIQDREPTNQLGDFLQLTLDKMSAEGMMDHLAGGYFRYTTDPGWQTPHFEKMLYTQATLAGVYLQAARVFNQDEYKTLAARTLDFVLQYLKSDRGGFISSTSAVDDQGEEGAAYYWTQGQLKCLLDDDELKIANRRWRLDQDGATDEGVLPRLGDSVEEMATELELEKEQLSIHLKKIRQRLLKKRNSRSLPLDDKVLAGWNGLLLAALSDASVDLQRHDYREAAQELRDHLFQRLWRDEEPLRAIKNGQAIGVAALEDYAFLAYGLSRWSLISKKEQDQDLLRQILTLAWNRFYQEGGWQNADHEVLPGMSRSVAQTSGPMPSPSAVIIKLSLDSGHPDLVAKARQAVQLSRRIVQDQPFWYPGHVLLLMREEG